MVVLNALMNKIEMIVKSFLFYLDFFLFVFFSFCYLYTNMKLSWKQDDFKDSFLDIYACNVPEEKKWW